MLVVTGHYRLEDKPVRTREALAMFMTAGADRAFDELVSQRRTTVRVGDPADIEAMARTMRGQGFTVQVVRMRGDVEA